MASGWIGWLASLIIHESTQSSEASQEMLRVTNTREEELKPKRRANSVDSLSPKSRFLNALNTIPMTPGVPYHTIIGDRGRGDSPNSSDGVVPYWSSHMDGAKTEDIVPSDHSVHQNPQAIEDVLEVVLRLPTQLLDGELVNVDPIYLREQGPIAGRVEILAVRKESMDHFRSIVPERFEIVAAERRRRRNDVATEADFRGLGDSQQMSTDNVLDVRAPVKQFVRLGVRGLVFISYGRVVVVLGKESRRPQYVDGQALRTAEELT